MNLDQALHTFIAESRELLDDMEAALLRLSDADAEETSAALNAVFRAAHTIKGSAGLFGLDHVVAFTHVAESALDEIRAGRLAIDASWVTLLLSCCDHMRALIHAIDAGHTEPDPALEAEGLPLLDALRARMLACPVTPAAADVAASSSDEASAEAGCWHISIRFGEGVLRNGMDPIAFIRYLRTLGRIVKLVTLPDALPAVDAMDPECCYLGFEIAFETTADKATIEGVFEFVLDDCTLRILPPATRVEDFAALIRGLPEEPFRLGEILARCGSVTPHEIRLALEAQERHRDTDQSAPPQPLGAILVEQGGVQPAVVEAALAKQRKVRDSATREHQSVRVDSDKLDRLIDLVGELIIAQAGASLAARRTADPDLHEAHSTLADLVHEVRDSALQLRMVKIGATFSRFQRVVHDVARELGKQIDLAISGEDTELDKTVVEKIGDPLTHLVRNAMDHGIETAELRAQRGKPARGCIRLNALHDAGNVVIEVSDDGGGLDRERILAKGVERGLVEPGRVMSDTEVFNLIFEPGFSTAEKVTNLSGRGVGMDVVKSNITALRGQVSVASQAGQGTTVTVRLPLTLAIIDGFQVCVNQSVFVVPLEAVEECVEYAADDQHDYIELRGGVLPLIRLRQLFDLGGQPGARQNIVVIRQGRDKLGLVVDTLLGEAQTVIKPLSRVFAQVKGVSGSSIRGNGDVALILDLPALVQQATAVMNGLSSRTAPALA
ncbi:MAG: chemotaxis protein CheA [Roseateles sp.]|nr:MAG: chemotaxis protein CheA [Roseateles sp.]